MPRFVDPEARAAADVRVKRGARWLDENFPGWESRIDQETLLLASGRQCICGQVFKEEGGRIDGFTYATTNLFTEANSWITSLVRLKPVKTRDDELFNDRADVRSQRVAVVLGFESGRLYGSHATKSDGVYVDYDALQAAWTALLKSRALVPA